MKFFLVTISLMASYSLQAAIPKTSTYEQLTGKKNLKQVVVSPKIVASAQKALNLARESRQQKNYILAIKRFNFILKYYSKTQEAKTALIEKASLYKEMGLNEQATYNLNKATQLASVKNNAKTKIVK